VVEHGALVEDQRRIAAERIVPPDDRILVERLLNNEIELIEDARLRRRRRSLCR